MSYTEKEAKIIMDYYQQFGEQQPAPMNEIIQHANRDTFITLLQGYLADLDSDKADALYDPDFINEAFKPDFWAVIDKLDQAEIVAKAMEEALALR